MAKKQSLTTQLKSASNGKNNSSTLLIMRRVLAYLLCLTGLALISGCSSIAYYGQSVIGHSRLMLSRQPVNAAIQAAKDDADTDLRVNLELALELRRYSVSELSLPDNGSYSSYIALQREFPVWTVVAAEEFSVQARQWCYPIIGCASYRGYFSESAAQHYADELKQQELEADVNGAIAYSTLGWFEDPLVPSMMRNGEADLAETLFHELAHQQLYVKNNSAFNEAFATAVGEQGATRWLSQNRPEKLKAYLQRRNARDDFSLLLKQIKQRLEDLYNSDVSETEMRTGKGAILANLLTEYQQLKTRQWQGHGWFDRWFDKPVNNARLAAFSTYRELVPEFLALLQQCDADFGRFYQSLEGARENRELAVIPERCLAAT
ncbi:MAG: aminopeptidase [Gammaproteobacteria bacterium]|nr:aminopeptidase [Gammaproteobacteria bacterium]